MTWNSTHTAISALAAILVAGFHYHIDPVQLVAIVAPLGVYIALREKSRIDSQ